MFIRNHAISDQPNYRPSVPRQKAATASVLRLSGHENLSHLGRGMEQLGAKIVAEGAWLVVNRILILILVGQAPCGLDVRIMLSTARLRSST